jgi:hypothetical protein
MMKGLILAAVLAIPGAAAAQSWQLYSFPDDGFAVQAPGPLTMTKGVVAAAAGNTVPANTYSLRQPDAVFTVTVTDFSNTPMEREAAIAAAAKVWTGRGAVKTDEVGRIDREFGRQLSVTAKDGAQSQVAVFFVNHKLYELQATALAPTPELASGRTVRFQQSLELIGLGAEAFRPENRAQRAGPDPGGPGGPGGRDGRRRRPPPEAFADCRDKTAGAAVQHTRPDGAVVAATCVQTPEGLAARPDRGPPGAERGPG